MPQTDNEVFGKEIGMAKARENIEYKSVDFARCFLYIRTFDFLHSSCCNGCRKPKEEQRMKQKYYVALTGQERRMVIESLNGLRNKLISAGRYTDAVDKVLIKVANAKVEEFKIAEQRICRQMNNIKSVGDNPCVVGYCFNALYIGRSARLSVLRRKPHADRFSAE